MKSSPFFWLGCGFSVCAFATIASATDLSHSSTGSVSNANASIPYRLFEPTLAPGEKAPLVVYLHGMGDRGTDNVAQTNWISNLVSNTKSGQYASYVLAPQINTSMWFQSWSDKPTDATSLTLQAIRNVIEQENIDASRVYVTGTSMGGMGTWDIISRDPSLFAAAVPMSGGGNTATADTIRDIPVRAFHGDADTIVPVSATQEMIAALRDAGGSPRYTEVKGGGHVIWDDVYADLEQTLYPWLFAQKLNTPTSVSIESAPVTNAVPDGGVIVTAVPEPGSMGALMIAGMAALARRRKR